MATYTNFFETLEEAQRRLCGTVVMYDKEPYVVLAICNHKPDGIFRVYLLPLTYKDPMPSAVYDFGRGDPRQAEELDKYIKEKGDSCVLLRKQMNSPAFNKFRPFPLGMMNYGNKVWYLERTPTRSVLQGLSRNSVIAHKVVLSPDLLNDPARGRGWSNGLQSEEVRACITADHPTLEQTLRELQDPEVKNEAAAFHRHFAVLRGPVDTFFLAYKTEVIGRIDCANTSVTLGRKYRHFKEVVEEANAFKSVNLQQN